MDQEPKCSAVVAYSASWILYTPHLALITLGPGEFSTDTVDKSVRIWAGHALNHSK